MGVSMMAAIKERLINIAFAFDCFAFSLLTFGKSYPFESFSSAAYRAEKQGRLYGRARPLIDALLGRYHCQQAYENAINNLPEDQRL
jgi:hypothetical protein